MATANGDRNLLFGILALQMDFINRDALVKAMHAWVLDKAKPLSQILVEQGAMSASRCALLEPLVQEHIQQHGDDAGKSLAAVSSVGSAREELKRIADPDVQASLIHLPTTDPNATKYPSAGEASAVGRRFLILRPHAEGGLGKVSVALDGELNREVALKEIQEQYADHSESRSRFLLEAEITGGLEHPSIVPVYGLGQYEDGRPFYAMRFIKGDSLKEAVERFHKNKGPINAGKRALELRRLLGRFNDVCDAVAYAHSRGVLHRDLKPGNVMLGKYGETLVVDWGLAKPVGGAANKNADAEVPLQPSSADGSAPTQMGSAIGTPQFMPPEQAAGRLDQMGPASDVYSLGATLYCLLTGKPPFTDRDVGVVLQKVQRGDFLPPRQVRREIPPALEAICLKAMALRPADRYPTARALAGDVEKWLADEPVSVYHERWTERVMRWARRRPSAAAFLTLFVLSLIAGVGTSTWLALVANDRAGRAERSDLATKTALTRVEQEQTKTTSALESAQEAVAVGLLRPMGHDPERMDPIELNALWELARLGEDQSRIRVLFLDRALAHEKTAKQFQHRCYIAVHAAVGLDRNRRETVLKLLLSRLRESRDSPTIQRACAVAAAELAPLSTRDADAVVLAIIREIPKTRGRRLIGDLWMAADAAAPQMDADGANAAVVKIQEALVEIDVVNRSQRAAGIDNDKAAFEAEYKRQALAFAFAAFAPRMRKDAAQKAANVVFEKILLASPHDYTYLGRLAFYMSLGAISPWLGAENAEAAGQKIVDTSVGDIEFFGFDGFAQALTTVLPQMNKAKAEKSASDAAQKIFAITEDGGNYSLLRVAMAVGLLVPFMAEDAAQRNADAVAKIILDDNTKQVKNDIHVEAWAVVAPHMSSAESAATAQQLLDVMVRITDPSRDPDYGKLRYFAEEFAEVSPKADVSAIAVKELLGRMDSKKAYYLSEIAKALAVIAPYTGNEAHKTAAAVAQKLLDRIGDKTEDGISTQDHHRQAALELCKGLVAIAPQLDSTDADAAAKRIIEAMAKPDEFSPIYALAMALAAVAPRTKDAAHMPDAAQKLLDAMKKYDADFLILGKALAAVAPRLDDDTKHRVANAAAQEIRNAIATNDISSWRQLYDALGALIPYMTKETAHTAIEAESRRILDAILAGTPPDRDACITALSMIGPHMDTLADARLFVDVVRLTNDLRYTDEDQPWSVAKTELFAPWQQLLAKLTCQDLVNILKQPGCVGWLRDAVLDQLSQQLNQKFVTVWDLVDWLETHRPEIDVLSAPQLPQQ